MKSSFIRELVERSRAGDQVAMALIEQTAKAAKNGNSKAKRAAKAIQKYIASHPPSTMAGETKTAVTSNPAAQRFLWENRQAAPETFAAAVAKAAPHVAPLALVCAIFHGPELQPGTPLMKVANLKNSKIAACTRRAFRLQRVRDPRVPISSFCKLTAAELGE